MKGDGGNFRVVPSNASERWLDFLPPGANDVNNAIDCQRPGGTACTLQLPAQLEDVSPAGHEVPQVFGTMPVM